MKRKRTLSKGSSPYGKPEYKKGRYAMYKSPRLAWPAEYVTKLRYIQIGILNNAGSANAAFRLTSNAFDVDPAIGGTTMPGFDQYAGLYQKFRTLSMTYDVQVMNLEAFNMVTYAGFSNSGVAVVNHQNCGNPLWKIGTCGPLTGMSKCKLKDSKTAVEIAGTKQVLYDDLYTGSTTSSTMPAAGTLSFYLGIDTPSATILVNGVNFLLTLDLLVQFSKPQQISV